VSPPDVMLFGGAGDHHHEVLAGRNPA